MPIRSSRIHTARALGRVLRFDFTSNILSSYSVLPSQRPSHLHSTLKKRRQSCREPQDIPTSTSQEPRPPHHQINTLHDAFWLLLTRRPRPDEKEQAVDGGSQTSTSHRIEYALKGGLGTRAYSRFCGLKKHNLVHQQHEGFHGAICLGNR